MATSTEICNIGLLEIGVNAILNLSESSKAAIWCARRYEGLRDFALLQHTWGFATKRVILAPTGTDPAFEYTYELPLPSDFIRLIPSTYLDNLNGRYKIENGKILADTDTFYLKYVSRETNTNLYTEGFREYLGSLIGAESCVYLTDDRVLAKEQLAIAVGKLKEARFADSTDDNPDDVEANEWVISRY